jgi:hypothetical protein
MFAAPRIISELDVEVILHGRCCQRRIRRACSPSSHTTKAWGMAIERRLGEIGRTGRRATTHGALAQRREVVIDLMLYAREHSAHAWMEITGLIGIVLLDARA